MKTRHAFSQEQWSPNFPGQEITIEKKNLDIILWHFILHNKKRISSIFPK